jgi:hypothetical protein
MCLGIEVILPHAHSKIFLSLKCHKLDVMVLLLRNV